MLRRSADQVLYYDEGVGTAKGEGLRGGAFGWGLSNKVLAGYLWLMENYEDSHESGTEVADKVYIFRFSRGAFTARTGVGGSAKVIRDTVRTYLADHGVPDADVDVFMGHREEGSPMGRRYKHRRPEYLTSVVEAIEQLHAELNELLKRPFKGMEKIDQPLLDDTMGTLLRAK